MADAEKTVLNTIRSVLRRKRADVKVDIELDLDSDLYDDLMLDSLDAAEISAALEDDLGRDPYSEGRAPCTVGDVVEFYDD